MSDAKSWYTWVVKKNRLENVLNHIRLHVPEIDKFFYPQIKKEYKSGRVGQTPLYEGYLFLHYDNDVEVFQRLKQCPFITTFVGRITEMEISKMENVQGKLLSEIKASKFTTGMLVAVRSGPFKGLYGEVQGVFGDKIKVKIDDRILGNLTLEPYLKEEELERRSDLKDARVQEIV